MNADEPTLRQMVPRVGVVDLGSNTVRLVVYERLGRSPQPVFNERVICGLGRRLAKTGKLDPDGVARAEACLVRFVALARAMEVDRLDVIATAATRDAEDGPAFLSRLESRCGIEIEQLSGAQEARLAAQGVVAGIPGATGLAGDMGGGSLELAALKGGEFGAYTTLPLGALRVSSRAAKRRETKALIDDALAGVSWINSCNGQSFYPVGGAWRALARLHMAHNRYPLRVIHQYCVNAGELADFCDMVARLGPSSLEGVSAIPRRRLPVLPAAALVLNRLLKMARPRTVVFSALGVREGRLFDRLDSKEQRHDPLLSTCAMFAERESRFGDRSGALYQWTSPLFAEESSDRARLRKAACLLADISWQEHADYRPEQAFFRILRLPVTGIDHESRAALALAIYARYGGGLEDHSLRAVHSLLGMKSRQWARSLGAALRLAETLSGGLPQLLTGVSLELEDEILGLHLRGGRGVLEGESVQRRLDTLADLLDRRGEIRIG